MAKQSVYTVIDGPLDHDGKVHANGDVVELDPKVGDRLAGEGIVVNGKVEASAPAGDKAGDAQT